MTDNIMSVEIDKLASALSKAQNLIENVGKDKQGYGYKYADLASCLEAAKIPLSSNGLAVSQLITAIEDKQTLVTLLIHESGQWLKSSFHIESVVISNKEGKTSNNPLQQLGAGITYARRYAYAAIIGIAQEDIDLGKTNSAKTEAKEKVAILTDKVSVFIDMCQAAALDTKEFAQFAKVNSQNLSSIEEAINNFESLEQAFRKIED